MYYDDVAIRGEYYGKLVVTKKGEEMFVPLGRAVTIKRISKNIETNEILLELEFKFGGAYQTVEIRRGDLQRNKLLALSNIGVDVLEDSAATLAKVLLNQEQSVPVELIHTGLGWGTIIENNKEEIIFKTDSIKEIDSRYKGDLDISPKGTLEGWIDMYNRLVQGNIPLEFMVTVGLSATLHAYIAEDINSENIIVHIYADSSKGKTTAGQLAISTGSPAHINSNGLMSTWNATVNSMFRFLAGINGLAVMFDESSMANIQDFTNIIYMLAGGKEKGRMTKELKQREACTFCTTIISTGEHSLTTKTKQNTGIKIRIIQVGNVQWTNDAKHAEEIKKAVSEHCGHASPAFADYIKTVSKDDILKCWEYWRNEYISKIEEPDQFTDRWSIKIATLLTTAYLAKQALKIELNTNAILDFIVNNTSSESRNIATEAYEYFLEVVNQHPEKFSTRFDEQKCSPSDSIYVKTNFSENNFNLWGIHETFRHPIELSKSKQRCSRRIAITPTSFQQIMFDGGFEETKIILGKWRDADLLDCDSKTFTRKRRLSKNGEPIRVYVINAIDNNDEVDLQIPSTLQLKTAKKSPPTPIKSLTEYLDKRNAQIAGEDAKCNEEDTEIDEQISITD